ncbi:hypothetical protein O6H91_14G027800 [Diphasiastrum complanatum]|uniref:Uncharacterized protein n=1 Tax=Diphasiastrum complanatum TaxID=34168 RepID=A0ACC2BMI9_DIPCM|nr:hypothetical protein O6H91_Y127500 [Diphasiastrum complanatum]KAJ7530999.1 hypothetical protein O6H91_14G027800 [Diphasiastrum complanatum]
MAENELMAAEGVIGVIDITKKRKLRSVTYYAVIASIGSAMSGYCSGVMSGAVLFIKEDLSINEAQEEMLIGSLILVSIVGNLIAGLLADKMGRKKTLLLGAIIVMAGCSIMGIAPSYVFLFLGRLLTGIGYGFPLSIVPLYIAEVSPPESRGSLLSIPEIFVNSGILLGYVSSFCLAPLPVFINWRLMLGLGGVLGFILACGSLVIPESPRWLVLRDRIDEAFEILVNTSCNEREAELRLAQIMMAADDPPTHTDTESAELKPEFLPKATAILEKGGNIEATHPLLHQKHEHKLGDAWSELLRPNPEVRRALLAAVGLQFFQQASGIAPIIYYLPSIFERAHFKSKVGSLGATVAVGLTKTLFISVATAFLDRSGRRPLLFISCVGMALSMATLAMGFYFLDWISASETIWSANLPGVLALCSSCSFVAFFSVGMGPISGSLLPAELFPLRLRAQGLSLTMACNRLFSGLISLSFLTILTMLTPAGTFFLFALISALSIPFFYLVIPETKGQILEEISA